MQMEKEEMEREKKKKKRLQEEDGEAPSTEPEEEEALRIPEAINIINTTMEAIKQFKVKVTSHCLLVTALYLGDLSPCRSFS